MIQRRKYQVLVVSLGLLIFVLFKLGFFHAPPKVVIEDQNSGEIKSWTSSEKFNKHTVLDCKINNEVRKNVGLPQLNQNVKCLTDEDKKEVYVPFSFLKKYFDIYGQISGPKSSPYFNWGHSYSKVYPHFKTNVYDPGGTFLQFSGFDVENRPRVKCVSAREGVPITTQWDKKGYYYATQICQYALAHYSKALNLPSPEKILWIENGNETMNGAIWSGVSMTRVLRDKCIHFDQPISLSIDPKLVKGLHVLTFDLLIRENPSVSLKILSAEYGTYQLQYSATAKEHIAKVGKTIIFAYGNEDDSPIGEGEWKNFTRNIANDWLKGVSLDSNANSFNKKTLWTLREISLNGVGCITNIALSKTRHMKMFYDAANWLVKSQNSQTGAWHTPVPFNYKQFKYSNAEEIPSGWISAMGSAHAMSVLTRAFKTSGDQKYLNAATSAIKPFDKLSSQGGVKAIFMDKYAWYEEYPTNPSSFVLNGFMYSLLGLYDLAQASNNGQVEKLLENGLGSLVALVPMFDTGSGTTYDLRHLTMGGAPKLARWDYHSTHVNLLFVLSTIFPEEKILLETGNRWQNYMSGQKAEHN